MILLPHMKDKTVAVFGLGRTGLSAARSLHESDAKVLAWDDSEDARDELSLTVGHFCSPPDLWDWAEIDTLLLSPGVPLTHPEPHEVVKAARAAGVPIIGDMELFVGALGEKGSRAAPIIAVTGTNGKSTTTALIGHILSRTGFFPQVGGNIGRAVLDLDPPVHRRVYVLEVSSYQLDLTPSLAPHVAVLLNITPDHLSRHGDMEGYVASKTKIFDHQQADDTAIIGLDAGPTNRVCAELKRRSLNNTGGNVLPIAVGQSLGRGIYALCGRLIDASADPAVEVADLGNSPTLRGDHNWQNACAAYAACRAVGAETGGIAKALQNFPGLAHRQEAVVRQDNVIFVNDSKATNSEATARALKAYSNIYWIAGGEAKEDGLAAALPHLGEVRKAYLIGAAAVALAKTLEGKVDYIIAATLEKAMHQAARDASAEPAEEAVVLLSPACASFDQFADFEARGDAFRRIAEEIASQNVGAGAVQ